MAALSDLEIQDFLKRYAPQSFRGVFSYDQFKSEQFYFLPFSVVVNAYPSTVEMGHWSAIYVDMNRNGSFFDSFGLRPWGKCHSFLAKNSSNTSYNTRMLQNDEISCGHHSIFFICQMNKGRSLTDVLSLYRTHSFDSHDLMVQSYYSKRKPYVTTIKRQ